MDNPHKTAKDYIKCDICRTHITEALKEAGYWPESKEVIKVVEKIVKVPADDIKKDNKDPEKLPDKDIKAGKHLSTGHLR